LKIVEFKEKNGFSRVLGLLLLACCTLVFAFQKGLVCFGHTSFVCSFLIFDLKVTDILQNNGNPETKLIVPHLMGLGSDRFTDDGW